MNATADEGEVRFSSEGHVGRVVFDRPAARNAMTPAMYEQFEEICRELTEPGELRAVVLRGAGGDAFVAGSDIAQFREFATGEDGIAYEARMEAHLAALLAIPVPTLAIVEGWAIGGGLNIAACCDIRIATRESRFGVPIARTLGNCLSIHNHARLVAGFGEGRARRMLLLGELIGADEALAAGFLSRVVAKAELDETAETLLAQLTANAPLTLRASKAALGRLLQSQLPEAEDLIALCYASADFREGVRAFAAKEAPNWQGR
ncbi:enoyl-CoA hydratase/isomerase family protein [Devosia nitrariae]|uniref:Enoyl-CoA hydratase n=1 Tax=Devosia nitrariae TaxID=2071872 RepID=A0ABQ5WD70_9HYPH|nr:enoyl-CoA hydratase/isomerase family protein [Devosia nitrariae]GLQ57653.1 enoyl-CoA hydratase [Devosia nitrariae]